MRFTGRLKEPVIDFVTGRITALIELNEDFRQAYDKLKDCEKISIEIKKYREHRSLNANAYFHVLVRRLLNVYTPFLLDPIQLVRCHSLNS